MSPGALAGLDGPELLHGCLALPGRLEGGAATHSLDSLPLHSNFITKPVADPLTTSAREWGCEEAGEDGAEPPSLETGHGDLYL